MQITERARGGLLILDVDGRMTRNDGYGSIKQHVSALLANGHRQVLLKLSGVLKIMGPTERIRELLSVAKLDTVFEVYDSESDAVQSFSSS